MLPVAVDQGRSLAALQFRTVAVEAELGVNCLSAFEVGAYRLRRILWFLRWNPQGFENEFGDQFVAGIVHVHTVGGEDALGQILCVDLL